MYGLLRQKTQALQKDVVEFTRELIRTPSPSLQENEVAELTEHVMRRVGFDRVVRDSAGNVVGWFLGHEGAPTLLLASHMDTVLAEPEGWMTAPHTARSEDGWITGLGASDCKSGLAAQVFAAAALKRSLLPLRGHLVVAATVAEENGRSLGMRHLLNQTLPEIGLAPDYALLGEPTNLNLNYGHDGWVEMEIILEGANPFHVDDAARAVYSDLELNEPSGEAVASRLMVNEPQFSEEGVTRRAVLGVSRRLRSSESLPEVLRHMRHASGLVAQMAGSVAVEVAVREDTQKLYTGRSTMVRHVTHAWQTDPYHPLVERSRQALSAAGLEPKTGRWELDRLGMGTAGSVLVTEFGIPTVGFGPGDEKLAHAANERVSIRHLGEAVYGTAAIAQALVGTPVFGWAADDEI